MTTNVTYLEYTNELLRRLNEVELTSGDFSAATGVHGLAKDAVNIAIREIIQYAQEWPFTISTESQTTTAGTGTYSFPSDSSSVDWDSFFIKQHATVLNEPKKLNVVPYTEYLSRYRSSDELAPAGGSGVPLIVYQTQEEKFGVTPLPETEYVIEYKYFRLATDMTLHDSTTIIPDRFRHIVIDGGMMYMMRFRSNDQNAAMQQQAFFEGLKAMRRLLNDDPLYIRSTYLQQSGYKTSVFPTI
tara:strand:- start:5638 stop:6366 length:729 start_codon:yes stop_codon:yes gene_type:complete